MSEIRKVMLESLRARRERAERFTFNNDMHIEIELLDAQISVLEGKRNEVIDNLCSALSHTLTALRMRDIGQDCNNIEEIFEEGNRVLIQAG